MRQIRRLISCCLLVAGLFCTARSQAQPLAAKIATGGAHTLFIRSDWSLWAMGQNWSGQLGDGTQNPSTAVPEMIVASNVTAVAAGDAHSLFLKSDGSLWAMGDNSFGELGDGSFNGTNAPEEIVSNGVSAVAAGGSHSLFIKKHGAFPHNVTELWAMGDNTYGQLGDGTTSNRNSPVLIQSYTANSVGGGAPVTAIAAGSGHSLFLKSDGSLWTMGQNQQPLDFLNPNIGQLGDGNYLNTNRPVMIVASNVTAIAGGYEHSLFLKTDGSLWGMGFNEYGQLGGSITVTNLPTQIVANNVVKIAAGYYHSLYIKSDTSLWGMGDNSEGALGAGTLTNAIVPGGVTDISAGSEFSLFLTSSNLWGMGANDYGELGGGTTDDAFLPELILGPAPSLALATYSNQPVLLFPTLAGNNHVLQMTTNPASGVWVAVTNGVTFTGMQIPNAPGTAFFRLNTK